MERLLLSLLVFWSLLGVIVPALLWVAIAALMVTTVVGFFRGRSRA